MKRLPASAIGRLAATMVLGGSLHAQEPQPEIPDLSSNRHRIVPLVSYENVKDIDKLSVTINADGRWSVKR